MKALFRFLGVASLLFALSTGCDKSTTVVHTPAGTAVAELSLSADPAALPANGESQAVLTALAWNKDGDPVVDGTVLTFGIAAGSGQIVETQAETLNGSAETSYVAGTSAGGVTLIVSAGAIQASLPFVLTALEGAGLILSSGAGSLLADGESSTLILASLTDASGDPAPDGTVIDFTTTLGSIEDVQPTNALGLASARLRSERFVTGPARVKASTDDFEATLDIEFVSEEAAHIELLSVEPQAIGVTGTGQPEVANLSFVVRDANGIPVDGKHAITVDFSIFPLDGDADATIHPASVPTDDQGLVLAAVNAGVVSGVVQVWATADELSAGPIPVAIHGGLPDPERFDIAFQKVNVAGLIFSGLTNVVTAYAGDKHGNPVPVGTMVWFYCSGGIVGGSDATDELGRATVIHLTADPRPGASGLVQVCAKTIPAPEFVEEFGDTIVECAQVMWSGQTQITILEPDELDVPNAGSATIRFRVSDANHNPLTEDTHITVTASEGELLGETDVTLPDTQSPAYTIFEVYLTDDDASEDLPRAVYVTISVNSVNGDASESIGGTIN